MRLIKTVQTANSIKWKLFGLSLSKVVIDKKFRLAFYILGLRCFRESLAKVSKLNRAQAVLQQFNNAEIQVQFAPTKTLDNSPWDNEFSYMFRSLLRLQALNIITKNRSNTMYKGDIE